MAKLDPDVERGTPAADLFGRLSPNAWLAMVTALAAALRFTRLSAQSFWYDEAVSSNLARHSLLELASGQKKDLGNPPLYVILLHIWTSLFGDGDAAQRALPATLGVLGIPLLYRVACDITDRRTALGAALLLAIAPFHVYLGQENRTYALVTTLAIASVAALQWALAAPRSPARWLVYAAATFGLIYGHYFGFFVIFAEVVYLLWAVRERTALIGAAVALALVAMAWATWLPAFFDQATAKGNLGRSANTWFLHAAATPLVFGVGTTLAWKEGLASPPRIVAAAIAAVAFVGSALFGVWSLRRDRRRLAMVVPWLLLPIALPIAISLFLFPFYTTRYGIVASPAFYLLVAIGLAAMKPRARVGFALAIAATITASQLTYFTSTIKQDWRGAVAYVESHAEPGDLVLFDSDFNEVSYARYAHGPEERLRLVPAPKGVDTQHLFAVDTARHPPEDLTERLGAASRVWLVVCDPDSALDSGRAHLRAERQELLAAHPHGIELSLLSKPAR